MNEMPLIIPVWQILFVLGFLLLLWGACAICEPDVNPENMGLTLLALGVFFLLMGLTFLIYNPGLEVILPSLGGYIW